MVDNSDYVSDIGFDNLFLEGFLNSDYVSDIGFDNLFDYIPNINEILFPTGYGIQESIPGVDTSGTGGMSWVERLIKAASDAGKPLAKATEDFLKSSTGRLTLAGLAGLASAAGARPAMGGGTTQAYQGPAPLKREVVQGKYGPVAQYAANGGLMHAYAHGGHVNMEDGGFVMTKRAVDGAGGPRGLAALVPGVRPIRGPGTGTSDSIPATIHGPRGQTPARVSNGEAYVPRETVQRMGGAQQMYNLMNNLQRRG